MSRRQDRFAAIVLVMCVAVVAFWEIASNWSSRPFQPFKLTAADLEDFAPESSGWSVRSLPVSASLIEPNVVALEIKRTSGPAHPVLTRLAHGYNMPDCMRIKGYTVELVFDSVTTGLQDYRTTGLLDRHKNQASSNSPVVVPSLAQQVEEPWSSRFPEGSRDRSRPESQRGAVVASPYRVQLWKLTSGAGDTSIWVTSMLRLGDFSATDVDIRSMAFPRIGISDDPRWLPQGITLKSFRHPIRNFRWLMRAKWNNSRRDLLTFLKLRQPAWASDDLFTLVSVSKGESVRPGDEQSVTEQVLAAHTFIAAALRRWRTEKTTDIPVVGAKGVQ